MVMVVRTPDSDVLDDSSAMLAHAGALFQQLHYAGPTLSGLAVCKLVVIHVVTADCSKVDSLVFDKQTTRTVSLWSTPHLSLYRRGVVLTTKLVVCLSKLRVAAISCTVDFSSVGKCRA